MSGQYDSRLFDCAQRTPTSGSAVDSDIRLAAKSAVPVLISAELSASREIACELDRRSRSPCGAVRIVDCRHHDAPAAITSLIDRNTNGRGADRVEILLLEEVHALSPHDQGLLERQLEALLLHSSSHPGVRVVASSTEPLFERVLERSFQARLYYLLNMIHIVVPPGQ
jgi:hypothetical protein